MDFEIWHIWFIIAILLMISEIFTTGFYLACIAIAAFAGGVVALFSENIIIQIIVFTIVLAVSFIYVRKFLISLIYKKSPDLKTGIEALIGRQAVVTEDINNTLNTGRVKIDGDDWRAMSQSGVSYKKGEFVKIVKVDSAIVIIDTDKI